MARVNCFRLKWCSDRVRAVDGVIFDNLGGQMVKANQVDGIVSWPRVLGEAPG